MDMNTLMQMLQGQGQGGMMGGPPVDQPRPPWLDGLTEPRFQSNQNPLEMLLALIQALQGQGQGGMASGMEGMTPGAAQEPSLQPVTTAALGGPMVAMGR